MSKRWGRGVGGYHSILHNIYHIAIHNIDIFKRYYYRAALGLQMIIGIMIMIFQINSMGSGGLG